jgi:hypothetical protein
LSRVREPIRYIYGFEALARRKAMNRIRTIATVMVAAGLAVAMTAFSALAASEFEGVWAVKDSKGKPFEITLSADGKATGTQEKAKEGTWKEEGGSAVITWTTGWTTKITKEDDHYVKAAYEKGQSLQGPPTSKSDAQKK